MIHYRITYHAYSTTFPTPPPSRDTVTIARGKPIDEIHEINDIAEEIRKKIGASQVVILDWRKI